jgi:hypothetical protein
MSNPPSEFDIAPQKQLPLSIIGGVGFILLFVFILYLAYLPLRSEGPDQARIAERHEIRRTVEAAAQRAETRLEAADPTGQSFVIPIADASRLVVAEFRALQREHGITQEGLPAPAGD